MHNTIFKGRVRFESISISNDQIKYVHMYRDLFISLYFIFSKLNLLYLLYTLLSF